MLLTAGAVFVVLVLISISVLIPFVLHYFNLATIDVFDLTTFVFVKFFQCILATQFNLASLTLFTRFRALNTRLRREASSKHLKIVSAKFTKISIYSKSFHKLCDGIEIINETYTFQLISLFLVLTVTGNLNNFLNNY